MAQLFSPLKLRNLEFKNRNFVSPMCQYSAVDGVPNDWHFVHLGSRAVGGAALVICEATAVSAEGRISPGDAGLWNETQEKAFARINAFISAQGCVPGIQIAHAGRKASTPVPWAAEKVLTEKETWPVLAPSAEAFSPTYPKPSAMTEERIESVTEEFVSSARRALRAGFQVIEIHMAHGYLFHEFLSNLSNHRTDAYGGSLENRMRFPLKVARRIRDLWPQELPVFVRISATDWTEGGWDLEQSVALCAELKKIGIDFIDCSTGGNVAVATIPSEPGYQVKFAAAIRARTGIATGAVGLITEPVQASAIIEKGEADAVLLARELLRDPYWPLHAARELKADVQWPKQYLRAKK